MGKHFGCSFDELNLVHSTQGCHIHQLEMTERVVVEEEEVGVRWRDEMNCFCREQLNVDGEAVLKGVVDVDIKAFRLEEVENDNHVPCDYILGSVVEDFDFVKAPTDDFRYGKTGFSSETYRKWLCLLLVSSGVILLRKFH